MPSPLPGALSRRILGLPRSARYLIAALAVVGGLAVRVSLDPIWGQRFPYITLFPVIMLSAWLGGFGPGLFATLASILPVAYLWIEPTRSLRIAAPRDALGLSVFVIVGFVISALNEAWRRQTRSLVSSEERLDVMLKSIGDAVIATDTDGRITRINPAAEALTGWPAFDAIGRPIEEVLVLLNEQSRGTVESPVYQVIREGRGARLPGDTLMLSRDGRETLVDDSAGPLLADDGRLAGAIIVFRDVSERPRLERMAREMAAIVESSDDAIVSKNLEGIIQSWNGGAERMFGHTAAEMIGQSIRMIIPKARWSEEDEVLRRLRAGEKVDHFETVRLRKDGSEIQISLTISPIRSANGTVIGASKIARDISERTRVERERAELLEREQAARAEVERASRMKDDFLAVLSHELRTPLNAVLGYAHLLKSGALPAEHVTHALQAIDRNARAQARLVESLLDLSRVLAGKLDLNLEGLDVALVVDGALDVIRPEAAAKSIVLETNLPGHPIALVADGPRLQQVLWNLLANAIKFTPPGGRVRVSLTNTDTDVLIQVSDSGQGIHPDVLPHIFDRFVQIDHERHGAAAGLGLGLSLVRELAQAHGGSVRAESGGDGHGSTFTVTLPLVTARPLLDAVDAESPGLPEGLDVLVVDDARDARELLALLLTSRGAIVRTASSGVEALEAIGGRRPDLLLADIGMPGMDGYALIRSVRERERRDRTPRLAALAVSAYANRPDQENAIAAGYDGHVPKPVDVNALVHAIDQLLSGANV